MMHTETTQKPHRDHVFPVSFQAYLHQELHVLVEHGVQPQELLRGKRPLCNLHAVVGRQWGRASEAGPGGKGEAVGDGPLGQQRLEQACGTRNTELWCVG